MRRLFNTLWHRPLKTSFIYAFWGATTTIFVNDNLLVTTYIEGESMSPTLSPTYHETGRCDFVLWNKLFARSTLQRGDVIQYMNPYSPEALAVKRVIALEGDTVVLDQRRRPRAKDGWEMRETRAWDAWKGRALVPPGHVWVEGDNVRNSHDSSYYGPISMSLIEGQAIAVLNPTKFWSKPWEGFKSRTKVVQEGGSMKDWTEGLPIELAEIAGPHLPP